MAVRIRLNDGINLIANTDLDEFTKAYEAALKHGQPLEVVNGDGKLRRLNPVQILYFEDADTLDGDDQDPVPVPEGLRAP